MLLETGSPALQTFRLAQSVIKSQIKDDETSPQAKALLGKSNTYLLRFTAVAAAIRLAIETMEGFELSDLDPSYTPSHSSHTQSTQQNSVKAEQLRTHFRHDPWYGRTLPDRQMRHLMRCAAMVLTNA